eukprot:GHVU01169829.1.p1 GENE.GHVU01169829.1~~GHVU01169829.1.p1  ORF type:complete len:200 (-),score=56.56 GHVU01169829.1:359-958(-)
MEDGRAPDHDMPEAVSEDVDMEGAGGSTAVAVDGASGVPQGRNVEDGKDDDNACAQRANEQTDGAGNTETLSGGVAAESGEAGGGARVDLDSGQVANPPPPGEDHQRQVDETQQVDAKRENGASDGEEESRRRRKMQELFGDDEEEEEEEDGDERLIEVKDEDEATGWVGGWVGERANSGGKVTQRRWSIDQQCLHCPA